MVYLISMACVRGFKQYLTHTHLEASCFLKDDCLKINCTVGIVVSSMIYSNTIQIPKYDIRTHFGMLLENREGSDVTFLVGGEIFHAHKLVLATRSTVFETKFFNGIHKDDRDIVVNDIEPKVFKVLHSLKMSLFFPFSFCNYFLFHEYTC